MMLEENNNHQHKLLLEPPKTEEFIELEQLAKQLRADNERKMAALRNTHLPPSLEKTPDPPPEEEGAATIDAASRLGKFGWHETEGTYIPYLTRELDGKLVSKRIAQVRLLEGLEAFFSWDLLSCMHIRMFPATAAEAELLNDVNRNHSDGCYGADAFSVGDPLILMDDLVEMIAFIRYCFGKFTKQLQTPQPEPCGFMRINLETVPYVLIDSRIYLPLFYFDGDVEPLRQRAVKISGWKFTYIKLMCKVQGVRKEFFEGQSIDCVEFVHLKEFFPPDTEFRETWPEVNRLSYRAQLSPVSSVPPAINPPEIASVPRPPKPRSASATYARRKSRTGNPAVNSSVPVQQFNSPVSLQQFNPSAPIQQFNPSAPMQQFNSPAPMQQFNSPASMQQFNSPAPMQPFNPSTPVQEFNPHQTSANVAHGNSPNTIPVIDLANQYLQSASNATMSSQYRSSMVGQYSSPDVQQSNPHLDSLINVPRSSPSGASVVGQYNPQQLPPSNQHLVPGTNAPRSSPSGQSTQQHQLPPPNQHLASGINASPYNPQPLPSYNPQSLPSLNQHFNSRINTPSSGQYNPHLPSSNPHLISSRINATRSSPNGVYNTHLRSAGNQGLPSAPLTSPNDLCNQRLPSAPLTSPNGLRNQRLPSAPLTSPNGLRNQRLPSAPLTSPNGLANLHLPFVPQSYQNVPNVSQTAIELPQISPHSMSRLVQSHPYQPKKTQPKGRPRSVSTVNPNQKGQSQTLPGPLPFQNYPPRSYTANSTSSTRSPDQNNDLRELMPIGDVASVDHVAAALFNKQSGSLMMALIDLGVQIIRPTDKQVEWMKYKGLREEFGLVSVVELKKHLSKLQTCLRM